MVYKNQLLVVVSGIALVIALYFGGRRHKIVEPKADEPSSTSIQVDFDRLTNNLKEKIDSLQRDSIQLLEAKLTKAITDSTKIELLQQLAQQWQNARYVEVAAYFHQKIAKIDSTQKRWEQAAHQLAMAFRVANDTTFRSFLLTNAIDAYNTALGFEPENTDLKLNLATCYVEGYMNQPEKLMKGIFMLREITEQDSTNVPANLVLGRMAIVSGQFERAIQRFQTIIELDPQNVEAYYYLGEAFFGIGDKEKAIDALKECKKLVKNPTFAKELEEYIQKIKNS